MSRNPNRLRLEQHERIAAELYAIRDKLLHLQVEVGNEYNVTGPMAEFGIRLGRALHCVDQARSTGDGRFAAEYPNEFSVHTYYPGKSGPSMALDYSRSEPPEKWLP